MNDKYFIIDDENLDTESENPCEIWKERLCNAMATILGILLISYRVMTDWLPSYLATQYAKEKSHIKIGCLFQATTGTRHYTVFKIEDANSQFPHEIKIPNTPYYDQNKRIPNYEEGKCYQVKYIEVDLKIYKKNFLYDLL